MSESKSKMDRRDMLRRSLAGAGLATGIGGGSVLGGVGAGVGGGAVELNPLAAKAPHHRGRAKNVIMFFLSGGMSHVDSFDPKVARDTKVNGKQLMPPQWEVKRRGQSGLEVTDLFGHIGDQADDLCLIRSMHCDHNCHYQATLGMHTGSVTFPRPSIGSWVSYGLGTQNTNLPSYVVIADKAPYGGSLMWDANFLPAYHQGVRLTPGDDPIPNLKPGQSLGPIQDMELALMRHFNEKHSQVRYDDTSLKARMLAFKTAFSLQNTAPEVFDIGKESKATLDLYGIDRDDQNSFGWQCLMARRLAERGVRFVELFDIGSSGNWDAHGDIQTHEPLARKIDKAIAALIQDLKSRGMLDETLVVFSTEFGRTPWASGKGRGHSNKAFTCWLAGGGTKGGYAYGKSDEIGAKVVENPCHTNDFHATIMHLLGMDHEKLTYYHNGRDFRLTDLAGNVAHDVIA